MTLPPWPYDTNTPRQTTTATPRGQAPMALSPCPYETNISSYDPISMAHMILTTTPQGQVTSRTVTSCPGFGFGQSSKHTL